MHCVVCMCVFVCLFDYHYARVGICVGVYVCVCLLVYDCLFERACVSVCLCVELYVFDYVCVSWCVLLFVCVYACVCVFVRWWLVHCSCDCWFVCLFIICACGFACGLDRLSVHVSFVVFMFVCVYVSACVCMSLFVCVVVCAYD